MTAPEHMNITVQHNAAEWFIRCEEPCDLWFHTAVTGRDMHAVWEAVRVAQRVELRGMFRTLQVHVQTRAQRLPVRTSDPECDPGFRPTYLLINYRVTWCPGWEHGATSDSPGGFEPNWRVTAGILDSVESVTELGAAVRAVMTRALIGHELDEALKAGGEWVVDPHPKRATLPHGLNLGATVYFNTIPTPRFASVEAHGVVVGIDPEDPTKVRLRMDFDEVIGVPVERLHFGFLEVNKNSPEGVHAPGATVWFIVMDEEVSATVIGPDPEDTDKTQLRCDDDTVISMPTDQLYGHAVLRDDPVGV